MTDKPINVALVGYGLAGKVFHAPLIVTTPGLRLASVVTSRRAEVEADLPGVETAPTLDDALARGGIDLVVVASPNDSHHPLAAEAIAAGAHVVVDKPFALTSAEAIDLRDRARDRGVLLSVFQNRRWVSDFLTLRRLIDEGQLGELTHVAFHFDRFRPLVRDRWRERAGPGSGVWFDLGAHLVDQALQLCGTPLGLWADLVIQRDGGEAVDGFHVVLRYPKLRVVLHAGSLTPEPGPALVVHGTHASYVKHGLDPQEDQAKSGMKPGQPGWGVDPSPGVLTTMDAAGEPERQVPAHLPGNYGAYYAAVRDAIWGEGPNPVTAEEGVAVMRMLELAMESSARRCEVAVPGDLLRA